jgi:hypothetical protein
MGMQAENLDREHRGNSIAYTEKDFLVVIDEEQIHWNAIHALLYQ